MMLFTGLPEQQDIVAPYMQNPTGAKDVLFLMSFRNNRKARELQNIHHKISFISSVKVYSQAELFHVDIKNGNPIIR